MLQWSVTVYKQIEILWGEEEGIKGESLRLFAKVVLEKIILRNTKLSLVINWWNYWKFISTTFISSRSEVYASQSESAACVGLVSLMLKNWHHFSQLWNFWYFLDGMWGEGYICKIQNDIFQWFSWLNQIWPLCWPKKTLNDGTTLPHVTTHNL